MEYTSFIVGFKVRNLIIWWQLVDFVQSRILAGCGKISESPWRNHHNNVKFENFISIEIKVFLQ
jgi:hypothetical protein